MPLLLIASRLVKTLSRRSIAALLGFVVAVLVLGAAGFSLTQHISFGTALYWAITTATTVGYGDVTPHNTAGRVIANVVMLAAIPALGAVFAIWTSSAILTHLRRLFGMDSRLPTTPFTVIFGANAIVTRALNELLATGVPVVLVAPTKPGDLDDRVTYIAGDPADEQVIASAHPERADRALIACDSDADALVCAVALHHLAPSLESYALTRSSHVSRALAELGVHHTLSADELVSHTLAKSLETPQAGDVLLSLVDGTNYRMVQQPVGSALVGRALSAARVESDGFVLGIYREGRVDLGIGTDPILSPADSLIMLAAA
ncbi:TrkA family potassium uptake protein [Conexibacter sp. DBS9H8]|uniref:potassium channel family protein n=1 Tax=Conexibacter sp. DBS9H8 TaxID=2937801 RepID=UPI00200D98DA|nr:potassium channel family protein [Conexibacter sp. DBS9H8]